jgi:rubrerythrin
VSKEPTDIGLNRTGIATSPLQSKEAIQAPELFPPTSTGGAARYRQGQAAFSREVAGTTVQGTVPPPAGVKGVLATAVGMLKGQKESVFLDKLGERAGFERAGTRLYEGALVKFDTHGSWPGGPTRERLEEIRREEAAHFDLVAECIATLGGDPTSTTPSANVHAVASLGLFQVVSDPRTDLRQTLEMLLIAELTDNAAWELLAGLAREMGHAQMAARFEEAHRAEAHHLADVRGWLEQGVGKDAGVELRE